MSRVEGGRQPQRLGRYEILLPIASGGMATVYLARARGAGGFERDVAVKLVHAHLREAPGFAGDLVEEANLAARIRHPNVVPILDAAEDGTDVCLVMEYVEGTSLIGLLRAAERAGVRAPPPVTLRILVDALHGLHAAHELRDESGAPVGLVHRDFSPQNILVGIDGIARLSDFGIAKASTRLGQTSTGLVKGKIGYMAPEQARGRRLDRRCDVWAGGVVAWELLAGRRLFQGDNDVSVALAIVGGAPPRLGEVEPSVPSELEAVVARALCPEVEARCATALDLARELEAAAGSIGGLAETSEVARFVAGLLEAELADRRVRAAAVLSGREAARSQQGALDAGAAAGEVGGALEDATRAAPAVPAGRRSRLVAAAGAALAVAGAAVVVAVRFGSGEVGPSPMAAESSAASAVAGGVPGAQDMPAEPGPAAPSPSPSSPPATAPPPPAPIAPAAVMPSIELRADAPIARVHIGTRQVAVAPAAPVVLLPLRPEERATEVVLQVLAADGRRASVQVAPDVVSRDVVFPPRAVPREAAAVPAGRRSAEALAPSPYPTPP